ncbi:MAG: PE-PPE domain-containing protein [Stackebrandtia sp.]
MLRAKKLTIAGVIAASAVAAAAVMSGTFAQAETEPEASNHYYVEVGGTGSAVEAPECTSTYRAANEHLNGGIAVPVCYPASVGPFVGSDNSMPAPDAPSYDDSVKVGYDNLLQTITDTHRNDPGAHITVVGFSQGADVANRVLETVSKGETEVPREQVSGKLYADPRQPGTGFWSLVPAGTSVVGATSPGAGPAEFPGMNVEQHCIKTDGVCDATTIESFGGYFVQHPLYPQAGGIVEQTIAQEGGNGVVWHEKLA